MKMPSVLQLWCSEGPTSLFFCIQGKRRARIPSKVLDELLGTLEGVAKLAGWFKKTKFFVDICPRIKTKCCIFRRGERAMIGRRASVLGKIHPFPSLKWVFIFSLQAARVVRCSLCILVLEALDLPPVVLYSFEGVSRARAQTHELVGWATTSESTLLNVFFLLLLSRKRLFYQLRGFSFGLRKLWLFQSGGVFVMGKD